MSSPPTSASAPCPFDLAHRCTTARDGRVGPQLAKLPKVPDGHVCVTNNVGRLGVGEAGKFKGIPHFSGTKGGHTLNLHQFARDGVTLFGHLRDAKDDKIFLAPDLHKNLQAADGFEAGALQMIDGYIQANDLEAPWEEVPQLHDGYEQAVITELDLKAHGIQPVIWAIGYTFDYSLVHLPVRDEDGFPIQTNGVSPHRGLYFVGMPWMPTEQTWLFAGRGRTGQRDRFSHSRTGIVGQVEREDETSVEQTCYRHRRQPGRLIDGQGVE